VTHHYRFDDVLIDVDSFRLSRSGRAMEIEPKALNLLIFMVQNPGRLLERRELISAVWGDAFITDHVLNRAIGQLRKVLEDDAKAPRYIETVPTLGYRFIANVATEDAPRQTVRRADEQEIGLQAGSPVALEPLIAAPVSRTMSRSQVIALVIVLVIALVIAVSIAIYFIGIGIKARRLHSANIPVRSLAVLPLKNLSGDASQEFLTDGITGELISSLGQIRDLRVISQNTAMQYKNSHKPISEIARQLNVDAVMEGSVLRSGDRVHIATQLMNATTGRSIFDQSDDVDFRDVGAWQSQVASSVAEQIGIKLTPQKMARFAANRKVDPQAYEAYLKGQFYFEVNAPQAAQTSLGYFQRAVKLDPNFARAWVGIGRSYNFLGEGTVSAGEATAAADTAVAKALELEPDLAEAYAERAWTLLYYHWDFPGTERDFRQALALDPNLADAHEGLADYLMTMGRFDESYAESRQALKLDPTSTSVLTGYCLTLNFARRYGEAIAKCSEALALDPNYRWALTVASRVYFNQRDYALAREMLVRLGVNDLDTLAMRDEINGAPGVHGAFDHWLKEQKVLPDPFLLALAYSGLGRRDQAFAWLGKAFEQRTAPHALTWVHLDPRFDALRKDPRFDALLRHFGLPAQPSGLLSQPIGTDRVSASLSDVKSAKSIRSSNSD
jgi:TolB-like protein/DNA-binding winged helix-turn-helix (wHTH) protein/lipoprotein NlpI